AVWTLRLTLQPLDFDAYFQRAVALGRLDHHVEAVADYERFLVIAPKDDQRRAEAQLRLGMEYHDGLKDANRAALSVAKLVDAPTATILSPARLANLCNDLAWQAASGLPQKPSPDLLLRLAHKAVEIEPYNVLYQNTLGVVLYRLGSYEEAIRCL